MRDIILMDGAAGTALWSMAEAAGVSKDPVWKYNMEHPEFVSELHRRYIEAGCDMIQTNTFSANDFTVSRQSDYSTEAVITEAVKLARQAAEGSKAKVYLSFGPPPMLMEPYGTLRREEVRAMYAAMAEAGKAAGADFAALETFMDAEMMRLAAQSVKEAGLTTVCSMTFAKRHRTMMGDTVQKIVDLLEPLGIDGIGMNCSAGPVEALEIIKEFAGKTSLPLYFKPNSGIGDTYSASQFADEVEPALDFVHWIGGCCGCDDSYIKELGKRIK